MMEMGPEEARFLKRWVFIVTVNLNVSLWPTWVTITDSLSHSHSVTSQVHSSQSLTQRLWLWILICQFEYAWFSRSIRHFFSHSVSVRVPVSVTHRQSHWTERDWGESADQDGNSRRQNTSKKCYQYHYQCGVPATTHSEQRQSVSQRQLTIRSRLLYGSASESVTSLPSQWVSDWLTATRLLT